MTVKPKNSQKMNQHGFENERVLFILKNIKYKEIVKHIIAEFAPDLYFLYWRGSWDDETTRIPLYFTDYYRKYFLYQTVRKLTNIKFEKKIIRLFEPLPVDLSVHTHSVQPQICKLSPFGKKVYNSFKRSGLFYALSKIPKRYLKDPEEFIRYVGKNLIFDEGEVAKVKNQGKTIKVINEIEIVCVKRNNLNKPKETFGKEEKPEVVTRPKRNKYALQLEETENTRVATKEKVIILNHPILKEDEILFFVKNDLSVKRGFTIEDLEKNMPEIKEHLNLINQLVEYDQKTINAKLFNKYLREKIKSLIFKKIISPKQNVSEYFYYGIDKGSINLNNYSFKLTKAGKKYLKKLKR